MTMNRLEYLNSFPSSSYRQAQSILCCEKVKSNNSFKPSHISFCDWATGKSGTNWGCTLSALMRFAHLVCLGGRTVTATSSRWICGNIFLFSSWEVFEFLSDRVFLYLTIEAAEVLAPVSHQAGPPGHLKSLMCYEENVAWRLPTISKTMIFVVQPHANAVHSHRACSSGAIALNFKLPAFLSSIIWPCCFLSKTSPSCS